MRGAILENKVFSQFRKRDGTLVPFKVEKIQKAIFEAAKVVALKEGREPDADTAQELAIKVVTSLNNPDSLYYVVQDEDNARIPEIEDVQDVVEVILSEAGHSKTVAEYKKYRKAK